MPAVAHLCGNPRVTRRTQSHEIALRMSSALGQRFDVVYLLSQSNDSTPSTFLAQRVGGDETVTDSFPGSAVPTAYSRVSVVLLVAFVLLLLVFLAEASACQFRTSGERTRSLWSLRHLFTFLSEQKESHPQNCFCEWLSLIAFDDTIIAREKANKPSVFPQLHPKRRERSREKALLRIRSTELSLQWRMSIRR